MNEIVSFLVGSGLSPVTYSNGHVAFSVGPMLTMIALAVVHAVGSFAPLVVIGFGVFLIYQAVAGFGGSPLELKGHKRRAQAGVARSWDFGADGRIGYKDSNEDFWHSDPSNKYYDLSALPLLGALVSYEHGSIAWHVVDLLGPLVGGVVLAVGAGAVLVVVWVGSGWLFRLVRGEGGGAAERWMEGKAAEQAEDARINYDASDACLAGDGDLTTEADWDALPEEERQWQAFSMGHDTGMATGDFESANPFAEGTTEYDHYEQGRLYGVEENQKLWESSTAASADGGGLAGVVDGAGEVQAQWEAEGRQAYLDGEELRDTGWDADNDGDAGRIAGYRAAEAADRGPTYETGPAGGLVASDGSGKGWQNKPERTWTDADRAAHDEEPF